MATRNWYHYEIDTIDGFEKKVKPICTPCLDKYGDKLRDRVIKKSKK